ncbi:MAG: MCE family protein [Phycisphaeraceae bacterium]|nr:MAG: MCE family protein [Phycisphaeraceae bacterium]
MSSWSTGKYNWLAGIFLLGGLAGAVVLSFIFAGSAPTGWSNAFIVRFSLADGASGLKPGSSVTLGGQQVGRVSAIRFENDERGRTPRAVLVEVQMSGGIDLYDDAIVVLEKPLLGTISTLNIVSAGGAQGSSPVAAGAVLGGSLAPPAFLSQAGIGSEQVTEIRQIISDTRETMATARRLMGDDEEGLARAILKAGKAADEFADRLPAWSASFDEIISTLDSGAKRIDPIMSKVESGVDEARRVVADAGKAIDAARDVVERNGRTIDEIIGNVNTLASGLAGDTLGYVLETLREAPEIARSIRRVSADAERVTATFAAELPTVRRILASGRQAADNAKIGIAEVVSQPWRLLYRPSTKELKEQLVYDSARAYAEAVGDLRAMGDSLESLSARAGDPDPADVARTLDELRDALAKSKEAERRLERHMLDLLVGGRVGDAAPGR